MEIIWGRSGTLHEAAMQPGSIPGLNESRQLTAIFGQAEKTANRSRFLDGRAVFLIGLCIEGRPGMNLLDLGIIVLLGLMTVRGFFRGPVSGGGGPGGGGGGGGGGGPHVPPPSVLIATLDHKSRSMPGGSPLPWCSWPSTGLPDWRPILSTACLPPLPGFC